MLNRPLEDLDIENGKKYTNKLVHRGPDHSGFWFDKKKGVFLGHTRLSILDLSENNNQPYVEGKSCVVFNGEIYNYLDIKKQLIKQGEKFKTNGDTEVLAKYIKHKGTLNLDELDGMFAFAAYEDDRLTLATDLFGEKPLYWVQNNSGFYFSSEPIPLVKMLGLSMSSDRDVFFEFMALGYVIQPNTAFMGLNTCPPATIIEVKPNHPVVTSKYWNPPELHTDYGKLHALDKCDIRKIKNSLIESLEYRVHADVDIGLFLSSGVDSSLIASLLKKELNKDILAMTISFNNTGKYDESNEAQRIANHLELEHIIVNSSDIRDKFTLSNFLDTTSEPSDNVTTLVVREMAKLARPYFKVAFTGTGADELFFGYTKHQFIHKYQWLFKRKYLLNLISYVSNFPFIDSSKINTVSHLAKFSETDIILALKNGSYMQDLNIRNYINFSPNSLIQNSHSIFNSYRNYDISTHLPTSIIASMERATMRESIEVRTPFLNKKLVETLSNFDYRRLLIGGSKSVLKRIMLDYLPDDFVSKNKKGFILPRDEFINVNYESVKRWSNESDINKYVLNGYSADPEWDKILVRMYVWDQWRANYCYD
jgi:asparagine synthase (glutamine-hydrolysing)